MDYARDRVTPVTGKSWLIVGILGLAVAMALTAGGVAVYYSWEESANGQKWAPALAAAEAQYGIPSGLLSRQAYEESHFIQGVIDGTQASSAGALGILQLMPQYFSSVQVPTPFSDADTTAQIQQAAAYMAQLYSEFGNWGYALAAYNAGPGTVNNVLAGNQSLPTETVNYVNQILADTGISGATLPQSGNA